jgi:MFS family permease
MSSNSAISKLQNPWFIVYILGAMAFWSSGDNWTGAPLIVDIARDLQVNIGTAALAISAYMIPYGASGVFWGLFGDRYGKAKMLIMASFGTAIFSALGAIAFNISSLCVIRAINGIFAGCIIGVSYALISDTFEGIERYKTVGKFGGFSAMGGASAMLIAGALIFFGSWRLVYLVYGIAELLIAFIMLKRLERGPGVVDRLDFKSIFKEIFSNKTLLTLLCFMFFSGYFIFGTFSYLGKYVEVGTGSNMLIVGLILSCFGLGQLAGAQKVGALYQRLGSKLLAFSGVLGMVSLFLALRITDYLIAIPILGLGFAAVFFQSTLISKIQEITYLRGTATALIGLCLFTAGGIGTTVNGAILNTYSFNLGFDLILTIAAILLLTIGIGAAYFFKKSLFQKT